MKALRKFFRKLTRYPRIVSHRDYMKLIKQLPQEQRKRARQSQEYKRLLKAHTMEKCKHRAKIADCESLKVLVPKLVLDEWKIERKVLNVRRSGIGDTGFP